MTDKLVDRREPGFYIVDNEIIDVYGAKIGVYGIAVYNVLLKFANAKGGNAFPSYQTIADLLGISRRQAINAVQLLIDHNLIAKTARTSTSGDPTSNIYSLLDIKNKVESSAPPALPSAPPALPSAPHALPPSAPHALPSAPHAPDQDPINKTKIPKQDLVINDLAAQVSKPISEQQEMFGAICEALGVDYHIIGKETTGQIAQVSKILRRAEYTVEDVRLFMVEVWFKDWRWTKHQQYPTIKLLREGLGQLRSTVKNVAPQKELTGIEGFREVARRNGIKL